MELSPNRLRNGSTSPAIRGLIHQSSLGLPAIPAAGTSAAQQFGRPLLGTPWALHGPKPEQSV